MHDAVLTQAARVGLATTDGRKAQVFRRSCYADGKPLPQPTGVPSARRAHVWLRPLLIEMNRSFSGGSD